MSSTLSDELVVEKTEEEEFKKYSQETSAEIGMLLKASEVYPFAFSFAFNKYCKNEKKCWAAHLTLSV